MCMSCTLIVVMFSACYYNASIFSANRRLLPYKYGRLGLFYFKNIILILLLKFELVVYFGSLL